MARFRGKVGYVMSDVETSPGIWEQKTEERTYTGEFIRNASHNQSSDQLNDGIRLADSISFVLDPFAIHHFSSIKYVEYMGEKWKVESVEVKYPRLILSVGGVYNEQQD